MSTAPRETYHGSYVLCRPGSHTLRRLRLEAPDPAAAEAVLDHLAARASIEGCTKVHTILLGRTRP